MIIINKNYVHKNNQYRKQLIKKKKDEGNKLNI